ncbi:Protein YceI [Halomonadaceae bacterium LMG 33818]|uniref:YceI family protein n=1 Tax=Cernens ardua TaxID=3402176 RepID=UPI003EDBCC80
MKFNKKISMAAGIFALVASLSQFSTASAAELTSGHYHVEPTHTQVVFQLSHFGFTEFTGLFSGASGTLSVNTEHPAQDKVDISVDVGSVLTTSDTLNKELKGADWFNVAQYPKAHFVSTSVHALNAKEATVDGQLTLHGVTRPVTLHVRFFGAGVNPLDHAQTVGFSATTTIKRSEFGVKQYVPLVGDNVHLTIAGAFERDK